MLSFSLSPKYLKISLEIYSLIHFLKVCSFISAYFINMYFISKISWFPFHIVCGWMITTYFSFIYFRSQMMWESMQNCLNCLKSIILIVLLSTLFKLNNFSESHFSHPIRIITFSPFKLDKWSKLSHSSIEIYSSS